MDVYTLPSRRRRLQLAVVAGLDPRTVVRWLEGLSITEDSRERVEAAAAELGITLDGSGEPHA